MIRQSKKLIVFILSIVILALISPVIFSVNNDSFTDESKDEEWYEWCEKWKTVKSDWTQISLTPGKDETQLNFAWYSKTNTKEPKVKISKKSDMSDAKEILAISKPAIEGYISNKATATELEPNTTYYYSYKTDNNWSRPAIYKTYENDSFDFIFVGDPQIGASSKEKSREKGIRKDSFNWNYTINRALDIMPNVRFILSAGDQIQTTKENEIEYAGYLSPLPLKSLPVATSIGNHDSPSENYSFHFNNPNASLLGLTKAGGDYYYKYGNTLFIMLNTNNNNMYEHKQFIEKAIYDNKDAKWRIVTIHHDIYGSGEHSNDVQIVNLRNGLVPIFDSNDIDVVLSGHDHTYARSKRLKYGEVNVDGILYTTANSSSGSKYYKISDKKQSYIEYRWQGNAPTFSIINIDETKFTITTYRTDTLDKIDNTYSIIKSKT